MRLLSRQLLDSAFRCNDIIDPQDPCTCKFFSALEGLLYGGLKPRYMMWLKAFDPGPTHSDPYETLYNEKPFNTEKHFDDRRRRHTSQSFPKAARREQ